MAAPPRALTVLELATDSFVIQVLDDFFVSMLHTDVKLEQ